MSTGKTDYKALRDELDGIISELQDSSLDIDVALEKHERATSIIKELETYLKKAENAIKVHRQKSTKADTQ